MLTAQLVERLYGFILRQAIPVDRNGDVPRIAIRQELNPFAPVQIFCSAVVRVGAETLIKSGRATDVFIRLQENRWADYGRWPAVGLDESSANTKKAGKVTGRMDRSTRGPIWGILLMEEA